MQIPLKLSLALVAGGFIVFGAYGVYEVRTERQALRAVIEGETRLLARSLRVAVENALRDQQMGDIEEMVQRFQDATPLIDISVHDPNGRLIA